MASGFKIKTYVTREKNVNSIKSSEGIDLVLGCIVLNGQTYNIFNITSENCLDMGCNHHGHFVVFIFYCQNCSATAVKCVTTVKVRNENLTYSAYYDKSL